LNNNCCLEAAKAKAGKKACSKEVFEPVVALTARSNAKWKEGIDRYHFISESALHCQIGTDGESE
jgi:hypothetical protein